MIQKPDHVHVVDAPDAFRGKFTGKTAATDYADQVQDVLEENKGKVAAFIGRDGQSEGVEIKPNLVWKVAIPFELNH